MTSKPRTSWAVTTLMPDGNLQHQVYAFDEPCDPLGYLIATTATIEEAKGVAEFLEGHDKARAVCVAQAALNSAREKFR